MTVLVATFSPFIFDQDGVTLLLFDVEKGRLCVRRFVHLIFFASQLVQFFDKETVEVRTQLFPIFQVSDFEQVFVLLNDAYHAKITGDTDRGLVVFDLLDEGLAAHVGVAWLQLSEVVWCVAVVHLSDLSLQELLGLAQPPLDLFLLLPWLRHREYLPRLCLLDLCQN